MSEKLDSYFFQGQGSDDDRAMEAWCRECRDAHRPGQGWFWPGSSRGYGPWDVRCHSCDKYIHRVTQNDKDEKKSETADPSPGV